ncbi:TCAD7 domain-containing protein [Pseudomonas laurentiana]
MLVHPVFLDAAMTTLEALTRLARYGLWLSPDDRGAKQYLDEQAKHLKVPVEKISRRLHRNLENQFAAIRREWCGNVLWYSVPVAEVIINCLAANDQSLLTYTLDLLRRESKQPVEVASALANPALISDDDRVVIECGSPVFVSVRTPPDVARAPLDLLCAASATFKHSILSERASKASAVVRGSAPQYVEVWPRLEAPDYVLAQQPFEVVVGFAKKAWQATVGGAMKLSTPAETQTLDINVELTCTGAESTDGWCHKLPGSPDDPTTPSVTFHLIGREPLGEEKLHLTMLEVRYVIKGAVCCTASRALTIGASATEPPTLELDAPGTPWLSTPPNATPFDVPNDVSVADLTIEIVKADRTSRGIYSCWLRSPHTLQTPAGPYEIDLGDEACAFASSIVNLIRAMSGDELVSIALESVSELVAEKLPNSAIAALREVANATHPNPPTVLLVSADPYVPWELARVDPPLDPSRPPFLGAQVVMGRWLRASAPSAVELQLTGRAGAGRPPLNPPASINVHHMAVMAGMYKPASGLQRLQHAEDEAMDLVRSHGAIPLTASPQALAQLLGAKLNKNFQSVGADAVHFAGHGQFNSAEVDSSVLYLDNGKPLSSLLFRSARYGPSMGNQPLIFLNACMIGIGAELLGDMGGFPGNCLRGGFGGMIGALWEVDDDIARRIAVEFWRRALPEDSEAAEPVGEILRDLRARFSTANETVPPSTYLAYVYYGHPRLRMQRVPAIAPRKP